MNNKKDRLLSVLQGIDVDRPPFICPGGMMNMVTTEMLTSENLTWQEAYGNPEMLANLALKVSKLSGIENLGVPFCMTVEAEAMGANIESGSLYTEQSVAGYPLTRITDWHMLPDFDILNGRMATTIKTVKNLAGIKTGLPIIVSLTGPVSLATSLIEPMLFFRGMHSDSLEVHAFLDFLSYNLINYAEALADEGADILAIADPSASGEILGSAGFTSFALPYINRILKETEKKYQSTLVHICGKLNSIFQPLNLLHTSAISIDSATSISAIREAVPGKIIIGNVSTHLLQIGTAEQVKNSSYKCLSLGVKILSPACGLSMSTPLKNIRAMSEAVIDWKEKIIIDPGEKRN